jgi:hypothetical protein
MYAVRDLYGTDRPRQTVNSGATLQKINNIPLPQTETKLLYISEISPSSRRTLINQVHLRITFYTCTRKVICSNLGWYTGFTKTIFLFVIFHSANTEKVLQCGQGKFLSFQIFAICRLPVILSPCYTV